MVFNALKTRNFGFGEMGIYVVDFWFTYFADKKNFRQPENENRSRKKRAEDFKTNEFEILLNNKMDI